MKQQDIDDLKQLIEFLKQYQVAEFDLDRGDLKIRLKFAQESAPSASLGELARMIQSSASASHAMPAAATAAAAGQPTAQNQAEEEDLHVVKSPIVGTFYASPSPGASAFVAPGDVVEKGQVICIVEAMKLMNEIESDASGEIVKCLVSNGQPIEFGQPLFTIRPA
ncbi:MAG: acetyl-CoA carboxylase biotin carboxyl carrier protein [Terracidiphilus sp.]